MERRLEPINLESFLPLRETICESLRDAIRRGILRPGERLMEITLAEELGVSRTPVREAIRKLDQEGYVVMMPRRGTYVANMSIRDVNEIFEIRTALESLSCGLAAERVTSEELERLQKLLVMIGGFMKNGNIDKVVATDIEFHDMLYQATRNERLVGVIHNLREQLTRFRTLSMSYPGRLEATLEEHRTMVEAIAQGDVKAAKRAAERHMEHSEQTLLKAMEVQRKIEAKKAKDNAAKEQQKQSAANNEANVQ